MKWEMHENSLFAVLLRSAWWMSFGLGLAISVVAATMLPEQWRVFGAVMGLPFLGIGCVAAWRQFQLPSAGRVERTLAAVRALSWNDFAAALEEGFRRDGYVVTRVDGAGADFQLTKDWRTLLVSGKRWKAGRTGVEPLRDLDALRAAREAHEGLYVATGEVTEQARAFAAQHRIRVLDGAELARLLPALGRARRG